MVPLTDGNAGKAKILYYDLASLVSAGALHSVIKTPGTIFTMDWSVAKANRPSLKGLIDLMDLIGNEWDINRIGIKYNKFDRIIGWNYWIGLLDGFFSPKL